MDEKTRASLRTVFLPAHDGVVPEADPESITDEQDIAYNAWCTQFITRSLRELEEANKSSLATWDHSKFGAPPAHMERAMLRTRYPRDTEGSEDVVALDEDGNIVILDAGTS